jgi:hypothetical protein
MFSNRFASLSHLDRIFLSISGTSPSILLENF